jgi:Na+/melibiose symporter-like transporter
VLNAVILWFYPLGRAETEQMQAELATRRAAENEDTTNAA